MNKVTGLTEPQLLSCFISSLKLTLGSEVRLVKHVNLLEAFDLEKEFEARREEVRNNIFCYTRNSTRPAYGNYMQSIPTSQPCTLLSPLNQIEATIPKKDTRLKPWK